MFAGTADEPRSRRAGDLIVLVGGLGGLTLVTFAADPEPGFISLLGRVVTSTPRFLDGIWQILADVLLLLAMIIVGAAFIRRRWALLRDVAVAAVIATATCLMVGRLMAGGWPDVGALLAFGPPVRYPAAGVAIPVGVFFAALPSLTLPLRRLGNWTVALGALGLVAVGATAPLGAIAGLLVASVAAASVHLLFGSAAGRPGLDQVRASLAELGVATTAAGAAERQQAGVFVVDAVDHDGAALEVKVYGRDAHDTALVSSVVRSIWYREPGSPVRFGRLAQVEHEGLLTLLAAQAGVVTDSVVTAGATADGDALLVLRRQATPLGQALVRTDPEETGVDPGAVWRAVNRLHGAGIAHGCLDPDHMVVSGDEVGIVDFRGATVAAPSGRLHTDDAQAFVTTVILVGAERAVAAARAALGDAGVTAMLPYMQPAALTPMQRAVIKNGLLDLDALRQAAAEAVGGEVPELLPLRRITLGTALRVLLPAAVLVFFISQLAGLDLDKLAGILEDATWWLIIFGAVLTQVPRLFQAISTLGASPVPLRLGPVYALQLAMSYIGIAVPTAAGRIGLNVRFFQRHGVPAGGALAAGALDGLSGFLVQAMLLVGLLVFTQVSLDVELGAAVSGAQTILMLVLAIAAVTLVVLASVRRLRQFVIGWARRLGAEALGTVRGLRSPRRLAMLFGGSLVSEVLFAVALGTFVTALGYHVGLAELLLITIGVSLLSGLVPIPGGVGVAEGGLTWGLMQAGVPEEVAFAAVVLYRLWSFYLPPIWGYFAFRWLERNDYL